MGRKDQKCSVCVSPPAVRDAIESQVREGIKLRDIERQSGFSKSDISRHCRNCVARNELTRHRSERVGSLKDSRIVLSLAGGDWAKAPYTAAEAPRKYFLQQSFDNRGRPMR